MKYFIIAFEKNWADEYDMTGFRVFTHDEMNVYLDYLDGIKNEVFDYDFGTNEGWGEDYGDDQTVGEMFKENMALNQIDEITYRTLERLFGNGKYIEFGFFPSYGI